MVENLIVLESSAALDENEHVSSIILITTVIIVIANQFRILIPNGVELDRRNNSRSSTVGIFVVTLNVFPSSPAVWVRIKRRRSNVQLCYFLLLFIPLVIIDYDFRYTGLHRSIKKKKKKEKKV